MLLPKFIEQKRKKQLLSPNTLQDDSIINYSFVYLIESIETTTTIKTNFSTKIENDANINITRIFWNTSF